MNTISFNTVLLLFLLMLGTVGCGQKGDLYLPEETAASAEK